MSEQRPEKRKDAFWRACRYLYPHRWLVIISFCCALLVGATFTGGLGSLLPIMQVIVKNDTVEDWVNRSIAEERLGVKLAADPHAVRVAEGAGTSALKPGVTLHLPGQSADWRIAAPALLRELSDPNRARLSVLLDSGPAELSLAPVPAHRSFFRTVASRVPRHPVRCMAVILGVLMGLAVFGNAVRFFQEYFSEKAAILTVRDLRQRMYDHALHLPLGFFGQKGTSDVTSRLTQDAQSLQDTTKALLGNGVQEPIKAAMALGLALYVSWELTLFIILFGPIMFALIKKFGKHVRRAARAAMQNTAAMLGQIEGTLSGVRVVKSANAERFERRRFRGISGNLVHQQLRIARLEAFNTPTFELLTLLVVCVIVMYAIYLVMVRQSIDNTRFFLVMACLMGIGESLRKTSKLNTIFQRANAAAMRLFEIMDLPPERPRYSAGTRAAASAGSATPPTAPAKSRATPLVPFQRDIAFEDVTFTYPAATSPALSAVSLRVSKGESVAVVGRNGSGKTTLLALLPRFFHPDSGRIVIDGVDIAGVTLTSLRRQIGVVTQEAIVFPGTIAENIAYANPLASRDAIIEAAKKAFAHDFILEKPQGYDTVLGEHGAQLSGGQRQRLCIARAILRRTPILILDEATSQVDAESEHLIQQAIESLMHERTTFVIAHRFSTILSADRIVVMERGQIVGQGRHEELLAACPIYKQLYERQLVGA